MKKYLIGLALLIAVIGYFVLKPANKSTSDSSSPTPTSIESSQLPNGWEKIESSAVDLKFEKKIEKGLKPQIVFTKTESSEATSAAKYIDRLIAGAKSAIPSLKITTDLRNQTDKEYQANLSGYYYNQKQKVSLLEQIIIKNQSVYTLTSSSLGDIDSEINEIFKTIINSKI